MGFRFAAAWVLNWFIDGIDVDLRRLGWISFRGFDGYVLYVSE